MKTPTRIVLALSALALAGAAIVETSAPVHAVAPTAAPAAVAVAATAQAAAPRAAPAAPLVNLPDFSRLVEQAGPAVVNIEAQIGGGTKDIVTDEEGEGEGMGPGEEEVPEFFKRFFGRPGMPMPEPRRRGTSQGTGFIISTDGYVLTNHHVIEGASEVRVRLTDRRELTAKVVGSDPASDIAVLKVQATGLPVLALGDSRDIKPGQWVLAIGSPFGFDHSVTAGIVSGLGRPSIDGSQRYVPFIQTDVAINRGNSGGPLLNTRGEVVGINSQIFSNSGGYMGVSFAIPIEVAMNAVRQIQATGKVARGQLGVQVGDVRREQLEELGLTRLGGAFVGSVQNGSAADKAGIRPGDVIIKFNGKEIGTSAELPPLVGAMPPGSRASVTLLRDGKQREVVVSLTALDEGTAATTRAPADAPAAPRDNALGVVVEPVTPGNRTKLGLEANQGVQVARVASALARQAGLEAGDVILQVGKSPVSSVAEFEAALRGLKKGDQVRLLVRNEQSTGLVTLVVS
jgi:serine protease Do